jgi:small subunit ribosomal protein S13
MPRIAGIDIPNERPLWIALTYIHGIGRTTSKTMLGKLDINPFQRARELDDVAIQQIAQYIDNELVTEGQLRRQTTQNIQRLKEIRCYRGLRHRQNLPCRGQQTQSNARTRKGRRRTVAGKASVKGRK